MYQIYQISQSLKSYTEPNCIIHIEMLGLHVTCKKQTNEYISLLH